MNDTDGVWRTVGGRRIFIKNGQDLATAMRESGKFKANSKKPKDLKTLNEQIEYITKNQDNLFDLIENNSQNRLHDSYKSEIEYLANRNGFDKKPQVLDAKAFENLSDKEFIKAFRGVKNDRGQDFNSQFKTGNYQFGNGEIKRGVGYYTITNIKDAEHYGEVTEIAIPKGAKIIDYNTLYNEHYQNYSLYTRDMESYYEKYGDKVTTVLDDFNDNISTTAMFRNYDVIKDGEMYIILNRSIIKVKE